MAGKLAHGRYLGGWLGVYRPEAGPCKDKGAPFGAPLLSPGIAGRVAYQTKNEPMLKVSDSTSLLSSAPFAEKSFSDLLYSAISFSQEFTSW